MILPLNSQHSYDPKFKDKLSFPDLGMSFGSYEGLWINPKTHNTNTKN